MLKQVETAGEPSAHSLDDTVVLSDAPADAPIQFIDLPAQQARIRDKVEARWRAILDHGKYINGPEIGELEEGLRAYTGAVVATAVASGTDALVIAMMGEDIKEGDAVFLPAYTYNATANAILLVGATPIFVDIDPSTFNICTEDLKAKIAQVEAEGRLRPRAVVAVDIFGLPADYPALEPICEVKGMSLIADAAQSFGGGIGNRRVGALAPMTGTSFFPAKSLGAYGDAGAMFGMDEAMAELWESIRWHGTDSGRRFSVRVGINGRMDSTQAAVLIEKLAIFDSELSAKRRIAKRYDAHLSQVTTLPARPAGVMPSWGLYTVPLPDRDKTRAALQAAGIPCAVYYDTALHQMEAYTAFAPEGGLPVTERIGATTITLPMHPYLSDAQVDRICEVVLGSVE